MLYLSDFNFYRLQDLVIRATQKLIPESTTQVFGQKDYIRVIKQTVNKQGNVSMDADSQSTIDGIEQMSLLTFLASFR